MRASDEVKVLVLLVVAVVAAGAFVHAVVDLHMSLEQLNQWLRTKTDAVSGLVVAIWLQIGVALGAGFGYRLWQLRAARP